MPKGKSRSKYPELYAKTDSPEPTSPSEDDAAARGFDESLAEMGPYEALSAPSTMPKPEAQLSPEERRIRDLEDQVARLQGGKDEEPVYEPAKPGNANILIHILEDGFTALGQVWFRGQEIEFAPDGQAYRDTVDRDGKSWLDLRDNDFDQVDRWGQIMFRSGPWPGKTYLDAAKVPYNQVRSLKDGTLLPPPSQEELAMVAAAEAKRNRAAPRLPNK